MKPIILDTNILLDIFVFKDVRANQLRNAVLNRQIKTYSSQATVAELADVISRPIFSLKEHQQSKIIQEWQALSQPIDEARIEGSPWKCRDSDDQIFLDIAFTLRPSILISKDNEVLKLASRAKEADILITANYNAYSLD
jgi:putative PIN family toxin of toxin-antitoxin system